MIEYKRQYSVVELTEDGLYHEGEVPPDYEGPNLKFVMVHSIFFITEDGGMTVMNLNNPKAKDKTNNYTSYPLDKIYECSASVAEDWVNNSGPAGKVAHQHRLKQNLKDLIDREIDQLKADNSETKILPHDSNEINGNNPDGTCN